MRQWLHYLPDCKSDKHEKSQAWVNLGKLLTLEEKPIPNYDFSIIKLRFLGLLSCQITPTVKLCQTLLKIWLIKIAAIFQDDMKIAN